MKPSGYTKAVLCMISVLIAFQLILSCTKELFNKPDTEEYRSLPKIPDDFNVNMPVLLDKYNLLRTKSAANNNFSYFLHDSLLIKEETRVLLFDQNKIEFTQIPIRTDTLYAAISNRIDMLSNSGSCFPLKSYYIKRINKEKNIQTEFIVTLIPKGKDHHAYQNTDFLEKPNFTGIVLYSRLNGKFFKIKNYKKGKITGSRIFTEEELINRQGKTEYVIIYSPKLKVMTKSKDSERKCPYCGMEFDLPAIVVFPKDEEAEEPFPEWPDNIENEGNNHDCSAAGDAGGGGAENNSGEGENAEETETPEEEGGSGSDEEEKGPEYSVILSVNNPKGGSTSGSGTYEAGTTVSIGATEYWGYRFTHWNGNVSSEQFQNIVLSAHVTATAHFNLLPQCKDINGNKANPLGKMELAPAGGTNIPGATFGDTRIDENGQPKEHGGLDLAGPEGTPIYSMFEGVIDEKYVIEQPNKIDEEYPEGYTGNRNDAGNRIYVNSRINGKAVKIGYCHLMAGDPVALNPRTGEIFAPGDEVLQGEIIGYIGYTGNASPELPHLHLIIYENWVKINPEKYLNATITTSSINILTPCNNQNSQNN